ncbi:MAG TPA: hypothetical protein VK184_14095 [Nostocaceae cyanobacterium]|nr:hypothetical protein [Nostocaceae cyanobacterium]
MSSNQKNFDTTMAKTRLLLALWDLGAHEKEVKKGQFTKRVVSKGQKMGDYQSVLQELEEISALKITKTGYKLTSDKGLQALGDGLRSGKFKFEGTIVGTWAANALLRWIAQTPAVIQPAGADSAVKIALISSYDEFKSVVLEVHDKLNKNHNLDGLVQIYRIRREIGERVSRENFNTWLLEMQGNDLIQLMAGEMPDITPDKRQDSLTIPGAGLRYYVKLLNS